MPRNALLTITNQLFLYEYNHKTKLIAAIQFISLTFRALNYRSMNIPTVYFCGQSTTHGGFAVPYFYNVLYISSLYTKSKDVMIIYIIF